MTNRPGDWGLLTIPIAVCVSLLVFVGVFGGTAGPPSGEREPVVSCMHAAPIKPPCHR